MKPLNKSTTILADPGHVNSRKLRAHIVPLSDEICNRGKGPVNKFDRISSFLFRCSKKCVKRRDRVSDCGVWELDSDP